MKDKKRVPINGEPTKWASPFAALQQVELAPTSPARSVSRQGDQIPISHKKNRGRVDIIRQTAHRGGKTVTVVTGFIGIGLAEKELLAKQMQKACGAGGTVKEGRIEIQGDQRDAVARILINAGFRPVFAGG
ncbi:MAG: translation initiation factor [Nitrospira sp.]|nr:MAG: translation initiation factor [Nitrospira sp.]